MSLLLLDTPVLGDLFPVPPGQVDLISYPRRGATIAAMLQDIRWNYDEWLGRLGVVFGHQAITQFNVWGAIWNGVTPHLCWPVLQEPDGRWNLYKKNPVFFERMVRAVETANRHGVVPQLCILELYSFSDRKTVSFDKNLQPVRHNVNGEFWKGDDTWMVQNLYKNPWLLWFVGEVVEALRGLVYIIVPFNEGPEKPVHMAIAQRVKGLDPSVRICASRNEETPGQYQNMDVGEGVIDMLAHHGWKNLGFLTKSFAPKADADPVISARRPWTFTEFFQNKYHNNTPARIDFSRVVVSSDGSRSSSDPIDTYNYPELRKVWQFCAGKGCNLEHQSRAKMAKVGDRGWEPGDLASVEWGELVYMAEL